MTPSAAERGFDADDDWLTAELEESRPRLSAFAYRMLGSRVEAEDAVQETWLRLRRIDPDQIENVGGLLTTVVGRVCLDRLRARRARPEDPVEEVAPGTADAAATDPVDEALLAESVGAALMVVLDQLGPAERVAFVLHDVFAVPFDEVAEILGRTPDATRQLASRARRRVQGRAPTAQLDLVRRARRRRRVPPRRSRRRLRRADGAPRSRGGARARRRGRRHGFAAGDAGCPGGCGCAVGWRAGATLAVIGGVTGFVWAPDGQIRGAVTFAVHDGRIVAITVTGDAARIADLDIVTLDA